jgi:Ca2+-binding RTX toxin-like protein
MRRVALVLAAMALVLVLASGVAWAVNKVGTPRDDSIRGTTASDQISGRAGDDNIFGRKGGDQLGGGSGDDYLDGGKGADTLAGGKGEDRLSHGQFRDSQRNVLRGGPGGDHLFSSSFDIWATSDIVACGTGRDHAWVDREDIVRDDCETVEIYVWLE